MSQQRRLKNWIDSYMHYARDNFAPDRFHLWSGLSVLSGALARNVWLTEGKSIHYPNIFVFLVSHPGIGKSTAVDRATRLLEVMNSSRQETLKLISGTLTQSGFCEAVRIRCVNHALAPYYKDGLYSSAYYYVGEASDSGFRNIAGDFTATATAWYDCGDHYKKTLKMEKYNNPYPSLALLVGTTFDNLKLIVNETSMMGGFASRVLYIVTNERRPIQNNFMLKSEEELQEIRFREKADQALRDDLIHDLHLIHDLVGPFTVESEAALAFGNWVKEHNDNLLSCDSERMQSMMTRIPTNLKKLWLILSAAESNDRIIKEHHVKQAIKLIKDAVKDNKEIVSSAIIGTKTTQEALNQFILKSFQARGGKMQMAQLRGKVIGFGADVMKFQATLDFLVDAQMIKKEGTSLELLVDPNSNL